MIIFYWKFRIYNTGSFLTTCCGTPICMLKVKSERAVKWVLSYNNVEQLNIFILLSIKISLLL